MNENNVKYYIRKSGVIVRVIDDTSLEYLNKEFNWVPNQEWYISMFVDGEDTYQEVDEKMVSDYIDHNLNSDLNSLKKTR